MFIRAYVRPIALWPLAVLITFFGCVAGQQHEQAYKPWVSEIGTPDGPMLIIHSEGCDAGRMPRNSADPWGTELSSQEDKELINDLLQCVTPNHDISASLASSMVLIGPSLWARLKKYDPSLVTVGERVDMIDTIAVRLEEARAFKPNQINSYFTSSIPHYLSDKFSGGAINAATNAQRASFCRLISFDIKNTPISVISNDGLTLLVHKNAKTGLWLELVPNGQ